MPYFDIDEEQEQTPAAEAEARRKVLGMIAGAGKTSVLGNRQPEPSPAPIIPEPRFRDPMAPSAPNFGIPALGRPTTGRTTPWGAPAPYGTIPGTDAPVPGPVRPNVAPAREDYPAKPEIGGWKKVLGLGLATLSGPQNAGQAAERILHGQRDVAERNYQRGAQE